MRVCAEVRDLGRNLLQSGPVAPCNHKFAARMRQGERGVVPDSPAGARNQGLLP